MKKTLARLICFVFVVSLFAFLLTANATTVRVSVPVTNQIVQSNPTKYINGCWAASGLSVKYYMVGNINSMSEFVYAAHGNYNDTEGSYTDIQNGQSSLSGGYKLRDFYANAMYFNSSSYYWKNLVYWVNNNQPIICFVQRTSGSGHVVVLDGYDANGNMYYVYVMDPYGPNYYAEELFYYYHDFAEHDTYGYEWMNTLYDWY